MTYTRLGILVLLIFLIGRDVLHRPASEPPFSSAASAVADGVAVVDSPPSIVFTCSENGKTLYRWQCDPKAPLTEPKYLGKTDAVLTE